ncbi:hypothetical protein QOZ95_001422 [Paenibacillus brasilensis]|uniref:Uncharacterized protein n=1 Tax=Paenibacillus brasilensis TaxID=128574 RepID=A0ABU0KUZ6_9BACL|nr:hypothetical protein [Paenibacillus brasilensis]
MYDLLIQKLPKMYDIHVRERVLILIGSNPIILCT